MPQPPHDWLAFASGNMEQKQFSGAATPMTRGHRRSNRAGERRHGPGTQTTHSPHRVAAHMHRLTPGSGMYIIAGARDAFLDVHSAAASLAGPARPP